MTDGYISAKHRTSYLIIVSYREGVYIDNDDTTSIYVPRRPSFPIKKEEEEEKKEEKNE